MDRHPAIPVIVEHGDELQAGAEGFEVLAQVRHPHVVGVLEVGEPPRGHLEAPGELGLAVRLGVAELVEADLLQRLGPLGREPLLGARARLEFLAEFGELGSGHQINPSSRSSPRYESYRSSASGTAHPYQASRSPPLSPPNSRMTCRRGRT